MDTRRTNRHNTIMAISEKSYKDLKEYWDYQRIREYNWEKLCEVCNNISNNFVFSNGKHGDELIESLWNKIDPSEFEKPPKDWVPKDKKLRLWNEGEPKPIRLKFKAFKTSQA
nr:hypothetical protein [uncultured Mediterranean phage uvMED]